MERKEIRNVAGPISLKYIYIVIIKVITHIF